MIARGIVLDATDAGRLILEASDAEVAQFGRGDLVGIDLLDRCAPSMRDLRDFHGLAWVESEESEESEEPNASATVVLRKRCGCERRLAWPGVPPPRIATPMPRSAPTDAVSTVRTFGYRTEHRSSAGRRICVYEELP